MKSLLTVKWVTKFVTSLVALNPELKKGIKLKESGDWNEYKPFVDAVLYKWLNPLIDMAGIKFVVKGKENIPENEPIIYTPNHSGVFDFPAVILNTPKPCAFISKKEAQKLPIVHKWMWLMDCVFIARKNKRAAHGSLQEAIELVRNGRSMVIFPEGTRSKDGQLGVFKGGAMKIAMETGAKVVPVLIEGTRERLEATGNIVPGTIYVTFLPAIETKGLSRDDFKRMPAAIRQMISDERDRQREERKKESGTSQIAE